MLHKVKVRKLLQWVHKFLSRVEDKNLYRLPIRLMYNNGEIAKSFRRSLATMGFTQKQTTRWTGGQEAEHDHAFAGQPEQLFQSLKGSKTYMKFTAEDSAEEHCHFGALRLTNRRMFTWLDQVLNKNSVSFKEYRS